MICEKALTSLNGLVAGAVSAWQSADKPAVIVALLACFLAWIAWRTQREHNRLSVLPLPLISFGDLTHQITIKLNNNGSGPLIVRELRIFKDGKLHGDCLMNATTLKQTDWYVGNIDGRPIRSNGTIVLLRYKADPYLNGRDIEGLRLELSMLKIEVTYTDVYGSKFPVCSRSLEWFDR